MPIRIKHYCNSNIKCISAHFDSTKSVFIDFGKTFDNIPHVLGTMKDPINSPLYVDATTSDCYVKSQNTISGGINVLIVDV